jgi:hypothetical protein
MIGTGGRGSGVTPGYCERPILPACSLIRGKMAIVMSTTRLFTRPGGLPDLGDFEPGVRCKSDYTTRLLSRVLAHFSPSYLIMWLQQEFRLTPADLHRDSAFWRRHFAHSPHVSLHRHANWPLPGSWLCGSSQRNCRLLLINNRLGPG